MTPEGKVRLMAERDLERVLCWRNHPEVRSFMYSRHEITSAEHAEWFARASSDPDKRLLVYERSGEALGFASLTRINGTDVADWGFYIAPEAPRGMGGDLGRSVLRYAFIDMKLHKVCGQVLASNKRSANFHMKMGFHQEGVLREQHPDGEEHHDVICFGILAREWLAGNKEHL